MRREEKDLHWMVWGVFPPVALIGVIIGYYCSPDFYELMTRRDEIGFGVVENATFLVLIPGVVAGFSIFSQRSKLQDWRVGWTSLACAFACIYFAGEEISWGQHYMGWETGEVFSTINQQKETNLHNINGWFNQKPKMLVEWWLLIGGIILPVWRLIGRKPGKRTGFFAEFWPTHVVIPTAMLYLSMRSAYWWQDATDDDIPAWMYDPETREYFIALYLALYLLSLWRRLSSRAVE
jgi:hypothetical protein